jgi:phenylacetate-CoA ligase
MSEFTLLAAKHTGGFILYGYTSWVVELARQMEGLGVEFPIRAVMVAGEHLSDNDRVYIERVMKAELFTLYASREVGFLGYECEFHSMHINEEWAYLEVVDGNGLPLPFGKEGRIIVTAFDNQVMPFIRYEIGDVGVISDTPCRCGRTLRTLTFKGRTAELIELDDNRVVSLLDIAYSFGSYRDSVRHYQIVQTGRMSFLLRVVPGPFFEEKKEILEALLVRLLHPRVQLRWDVTDTIPEATSGKAVYFVRNFEHP